MEQTSYTLNQPGQVGKLHELDTTSLSVQMSAAGTPFPSLSATYAKPTFAD